MHNQEYKVQVKTIKDLEDIYRKECPYCVEHFNFAKRINANLIWDSKSNDIIGITFDGTKNWAFLGEWNKGFDSPNKD